MFLHEYGQDFIITLIVTFFVTLSVTKEKDFSATF